MVTRRMDLEELEKIDSKKMFKVSKRTHK